MNSTDHTNLESMKLYCLGWKHSEEYGAGTRKRNLEFYEDKVLAKQGHKASSIYAAGWEDYAADNPKYTSLHQR